MKKARFLLTKEEFEAIAQLRPVQGKVYIEALFGITSEEDRAELVNDIEGLSGGCSSRVIVDITAASALVKSITEYVVTDDLDGF